MLAVLGVGFWLVGMEMMDMMEMIGMMDMMWLMGGCYAQ